MQNKIISDDFPMLVFDSSKEVVDFNKKFLEPFNIPKNEKPLFKYLKKMMGKNLINKMEALISKGTSFSYLSNINNTKYLITGTYIQEDRYLLGLIPLNNEGDNSVISTGERAKILLKALTDIIFIINRDLKIVDMSLPGSEELFVSKDKILGSYLKDIIPFDIYERAMEGIYGVFEDSKERSIEYTMNINGEVNYYQCRFNKISQDEIFAIIKNITVQRKANSDKEKMVDKIQHAQKLESLGLLAGGIAHDFNNLLTGVLGNVGLAQLVLSPRSPAVEHLAGIEKSARRASELCRQLLAYSGKGKVNISIVDINEIIEDITYLVGASISKKAVMKYNLERNIPKVKVDVSQIRQVIMNLIINASDAIGESSGVISITSGVMHCDVKYLEKTFLDDNLENGLYVYIEVSDTGIGMKRETVKKIFDPFFSTKFTGRGLGLAATLGIMRSHKGAIKVYTEESRGTTFKLLFPVVEDFTENESHEIETKIENKSGTVLMVDDEDSIRALGKNSLSHIGYNVITAIDGREAVRLYETYKDEIEVIVLDLTMPHLGGEETFRELRRINQDVKVILSSGYNEIDVIRNFVGKGLAGFLQKPYKPRDIIRKVNEVMKSNLKIN